VTTVSNTGWYLYNGSSTTGNSDRTAFATLFERPSQTSFCSSTSDRTVIIDLLKYNLELKNLTLACQYQPQTYLSNFSVTGSNDKMSWNNLLTETSQRVTQGAPYTWVITNSDKRSYRYFKFESSSSSQILLSGIEMYGTLTKIKK